jgi:hypothetical protein
MRRAKTRSANTGQRTAARAMSPRATHHHTRKAVRRLRPEVLPRPDFLPLAIH